ncbi:MAG: exodeoxyribonuclease III [Clostridiales bacterium]|jgi:exodeoxyribonuclease-3|nr:exodeoxyribonuclease III [Clostridiales bacterium]
MLLASYNVNGLRAIMKKGFDNFISQNNFDIVCLQEIKMLREQAHFEFTGYESFWNSARRLGYSGTAVFTKEKPLGVTYGIGVDGHDDEGRVITLEFEDFFLINCYTPNSQRELARLPYRLEWEESFLKYLISIDKQKPLVLCGDLNVAHNEIDLKNPKANRNNAGFSPQEREKFSILLSHGFLDTFRCLYPNKVQYTWWSYFGNARANNIGWRIDYFVVSERLKDNLLDATILDQVQGSDHCPVTLELNF